MIDDKVRSIVRSLSETRGKDFFNTIVLALSNVINADFTFVARLDTAYTTASTISLAMDDSIVDNISYTLKGTPCANVADNNVCIHTSNIQNLFPTDQLLVDMGINAYVGTPLFDRTGTVIGILVALYRDPINNSSSVEALFLLFAGLIGGELEKIEQTQQLLLAQRALDTTSDTVMICNHEEEIIYINAAYEQISGYKASEVIGFKPGHFKSMRQDKVFYEEMWSSIQQTGSWSGEVWNRRKDGSLYLIWLTLSSIKDEQGEVTHYTGIAHDITEKKASEEKIHFQATHDLLTSLPNRHLFSKYLVQSISVSKRQNSRFAVILLDLDQFKVINDTLGHHVGDELLLQVSERLRQTIRDSDIIARLGGDEFVLLLHDVKSVDEVSALADKVLNQLRAPLLVEGRPCEITASIGITLYPEDNGSPEELLAHADQAMYKTKQRGRDGFSFFNVDMQWESERRLLVKEQLRKAIDDREFIVYYQPIIDLSTHKIVKCEALVRWQNSSGELIPPDAFIPVAEEFGYITSIGEQVLEQVCIDWKQLRSQGFNDITVAVNRSVQEFPRSAQLITAWLQMLEKYQLSYDAIIFEITESLLAPENKVYLGALELLQRAGSGIAIDDFGTGYSSLSYLQRFPVDILKIDRSFVSRLSELEQENMLVTSIIAMAKALSIKVVAEGIETELQYEILTNMGCEFGQGYFIARPMPFEALIEFLEQG